MSKNKIKVLGFPVFNENYDRSKLEGLTPRQLNELAMDDPECFMWDTLDSFQTDLNDDYVDTDGNWIFFVEEE